MFLCGNFCNNTSEDISQQVIVSNIDDVRKLEKERKSHLEEGSEFSVKLSTAMIKSSHYDSYLQTCKKTNAKFVDKEFPTNSQSLDFSVPNRELTWRRISQIVPGFVMVENKINPSDIYQGNIGDCYFLASIAALAEVPKLIQNIFLNNFQENGYCIYKVVANVQGVITQVVIDDFIPVYATTNRPVFCKANGKEVWVMLLEKAWAKIKGSYGAISAGTPHEVFNTFCMAPSFSYPIHESHSKEYKDIVWNQLQQCAKHNMPTCAGSSKEVGINGIKPFHAYTVLNCMTIPVSGKNHRIIRMRNPWGSTQYNGYASQNDKQFWNKVPIQYKEAMLPPQGVDDGDFVMPFSELIKQFQCVQVCHFRSDFSYEFQFIPLTKQQPSFIRLQVSQDHEAYITLQKIYNQQAKKELAKGSQNYGYTRLVIAREQGKDNYEYFQSKLQTNVGDTSLRCNFKKGSYLIMVEASYPTNVTTFKSVLSYYYATLEDRNNKKLTVLKNIPHKMDFLTSMLKNHAHRLSSQGDTTKLSARPQDKIITTLLNEQGGYGYIVCSLQENTNFKLRILVDYQAIEDSGFELMTDLNYKTEIDIYAGSFEIFIFSLDLKNHNTDQISFPPNGFKISKVV